MVTTAACPNGGEGGGWVESWGWAFGRSTIPPRGAFALSLRGAAGCAGRSRLRRVPGSHAKSVAREHGARKTSRQLRSREPPVGQEAARRTCPRPDVPDGRCAARAAVAACARARGRLVRRGVDHAAPRPPPLRAADRVAGQSHAQCSFRIPFGDHPLKLERYRED